MVKPRYIFIPLTLIFILGCSAVYFLRDIFTAHNTDWRVVFAANFVFMLLSSISILIQLRTTKSNNPHAFVRAVLAGMFLKMFAVIAAVLAYVLGSGKDYSNRAVFVSLLLYLVYLVSEVFLSVRYLKHRTQDA